MSVFPLTPDGGPVFAAQTAMVRSGVVTAAEMTRWRRQLVAAAAEDRLVFPVVYLAFARKPLPV